MVYFQVKHSCLYDKSIYFVYDALIKDLQKCLFYVLVDPYDFVNDERS